ncbi:MAG: nitrile hydratase subunit beta [Dehalococcoidia bacterium]
MNGIHDMGGMHGFGPVVREENEPVFHEPWEGRVFGMSIATGRHAPFSRFDIESMDPAHYLASSYYERWLVRMEKGLIRSGYLTPEELDARTGHFLQDPNASVPRVEDPAKAKRVLKSMSTRHSPRRDVGVVPRFGIGDEVRARNINPPGHTRLPRYVRGKRGVVHRFHGVHDFQDTVPRSTDPQPQPVYSVRFDSRELWDEDAEPNQSLFIDMWQSYLEPV